MAETRILTIRSIPDEAKTSKKGDRFWVSADTDGVEWLVWRNETLRNEVAARVDKAVEYVVAIIESNGKTYRSIEGIPGVVEPEKKGTGGGGFRKSDPVERASIEAQVALKAAVELSLGLPPEDRVSAVLDIAPRLNNLLRKMSGAPADQPRPAGQVAGAGTKAGEGRSNPKPETAQVTEPSSPAAPASWPCEKCQGTEFSLPNERGFETCAGCGKARRS